MISTRNPTGLPDVRGLRRLTQPLAMLDAILCPEWQYRCFSFSNRWCPGQQMASMRSGQGDHWFALFGADGCWLKGFDHECRLWSDGPGATVGLFDGVPPEFTARLAEPALAIRETTFYLWRGQADSRWRCGRLPLPSPGDDPDGSRRLLQWLDGRPDTYRRWAEGYYERPVPLAAAEPVYTHQPLGPEIVRALNAALTIDDLRADAAEIGYATA